ncbi:MAG TPA: ATP-binding protein [Polyangiaceae bacterium]|nr:ATP-binding protein [Polyangiaceae bacterium]
MARAVFQHGEFLPGRSAAAVLVRSKDWSRTSLGPIDYWPRSLRSYVDLILEMPTAAVLLWGPDQVQIHNEGFAALVGESNSRCLGRPYRECWPEAHAMLDPWIQKVLTTGVSMRVTRVPLTVTRHGFHEEAYFAVALSPLRNDDGAVSGIFQHVTEVTELVLSERRAETLRRLVSTLAAANGTTEAAARVLSSNREDVPYFAVYLWDEVGRKLVRTAATGMSPDGGDVDWPRVRELATRVAESGTPEQIEPFGVLLGSDETWSELRTIRAGLTLPIRRSPTATPAGAVVFGVSPRLRLDKAYRGFLSGLAEGFGAQLARDRATLLDAPDDAPISQRGGNPELEELRSAAESAQRAKDEFLAMLGHELRNPLAPILTALHLMRMRGGSALERERNVIERQAQHLVRLVDDLLDISRVTRGKIELRKRRIELCEPTARAIERVSPLFEQRGHELVVNVPENGLLVDADPERLTQVIANLLTNAAKYTENGGHITVTGERQGIDVVLSVRDTGIGIEPLVLPRIFDVFTQGRQGLDRGKGGLGLGLAIVRSLVELHGGTVAAESAGPGLGSEFTVRIPSADPAESAPDSQTPRPSTPAPFAPRRVLIVDDNEDAAETLKQSLEAAGHSVRVAHDGAAALRAVADFSPDVAVLDIGLPVMDGYELARRLREQPTFRALPLIALTGYGSETDRTLASAAGFSAHLVKPVAVDRLEALVLGLTREPALRGPAPASR